MLKKITGIIALFCLAAGAAVYLSSCAQIAGPLSPDIKLNAASDTAGSELLQVDSLDMPGAVSETARAYFNLPLDPATVNSTNILMYTLDAGGTSETRFNDYTLAYNASGQELIITHSSGTWSADTAYRIELTTGLRTIAGTQLDGNYNDIPEVPQFDNFHMRMSFGAPPFSYINKDRAVLIDLVNTTWASNANPFPGSSFVFGQNYGYISATYSHVTITVRFTTGVPIPADFALDATTFYSTPTSLHPNVIFTDGNNNPVNPLSIAVSTTLYPNDTLTLVFNNLQPSSKYLFKLKGGLTGIQSSDGSTMRLNRHYYFNGNGSTYADASDDTEPAVFMTQTNEAQNIPRVYVVSAVWDNPNRRYAVTINVPSGIGTLDPASVTNNNFLLWNNNSQVPIIPASLVLDNSLAPNPVVYVYVPLVLSPYGAGTYEVFLTVRKEVKSADGISLDQNNDGVLMTDDDNFQSGSTNIDGY